MRIHVSVLTSLTLALSLGAAGVAVAEPPKHPGSRASETGQEQRAEQAREALATVERLFAPSPETGSPRAAAVRQEPDATIALRDLRLRVDDLPEGERRDAERWFLRPTDPDQPGDDIEPNYTVDEQPPICGTDVCIQWVASTQDAPDGASTEDKQAHVEHVRDVVQGVHDTFVAGGYRAPKSDVASDNNGGDGRTDVYLANLRPGLYGYCTTDDPDLGTGGWGASAYCVLDNDYDPVHYPANTPEQNLRVTAAHEYFHAIQFAYDITEDGWLMEGTAAWAEDELFDAVNDNRFFLKESPLRTPYVPLDRSAGQWWYGTWIWFRYLSEQHGGPNIIRAIWNRVDSTKGAAADSFSTQGVKQVLAARGLKLERVLSRFHADNRHPARTYGEGKHYAAAPLAGKFTLRPNRSTRWQATRRDHLSAATVRLVPARKLKARNWRLRLNLDLAPKPARRGAAATVKVYKKSGKIVTADVNLNRKGDATISRPFSRRTVKFVELTLTNGSARYDLSTCWQQNTPYACGGADPRDENMRLAFRGTSFRR